MSVRLTIRKVNDQEGGCRCIDFTVTLPRTPFTLGEEDSEAVRHI